MSSSNATATAAASTSSLAAQSAKSSLKRARELFDTSPQEAFIPRVDRTLFDASVARRLRTSYNNQEPTKASAVKNQKEEHQLIVSTVNEDEDHATSVQGGVLALKETTTDKKDSNSAPIGGGILVVSAERDIDLLLHLRWFVMFSLAL